MTRVRRRGAALTAVVLLLVLGLSVVASADSSGPVLLTRRVDSTDPANTRLSFLYTGATEDVAGTQLDENGTTVGIDAPKPFPPATKIAVAMVFDTSAAMDTSGALVSAKEGAKAWVRGRTGAQKDNEVISVFIASGTGQMIQDFTSDEGRLLAAIDKVAPASDEAAVDSTALWSAVRQAGADLGDQSEYQPNLLIMTAQSDTASPKDEAAARGQVVTSQAAVFAVGYTGGKGFSTGGLQSLVNDAGGELYTTTDATQISDLVGQVDSAINSQQYILTFPSSVPQGEISNLELSVGDSVSKTTVVIGGDVQGTQALSPRATTSSGGIAFLQSGLGLVLIVLLVLIAAAGLAYAITLIFVKDDQLSEVLQPYSEPVDDDELDDLDDRNPSMAKTAIIQRAVEITEQVAESRGVLVRAESALERANLPLRAGEALFFYAAIVVVVTILALAATGSLIVGLIVGLLAALVPVGIVNFLASRRKKTFTAQLPDTLQLLSGTLRAGYSLMQGVEAVSQEVTDPMGQELRRVVTESRLGRPLEDALDGTAVRMDSADFAWAVMAIRIQREVGGNLSELLLTVADTMTHRERLRRDVASLTAEGRMSAIVLVALPVLLGLAMFLLNPDYTGQLIHTTLGNIMLGLSVVSILIGFFWMKKIIDIEI